MEKDPKKSLMKRPESADYLTISIRKLDQLKASGSIPYVMIDTCVRFVQADLDAFIESCKEGR